MSSPDQENLNARDILESVAVKVRCLADIVACMEHEENLYLSSEGISGLYGFLDHIYNEIRSADARLTA